MPIAITQAMIDAPGGARFTAPGDYELTSDLFYSAASGLAIQNNAFTGKVRLFGNGYRLFTTAAPTTAIGVGVAGPCSLEVQDLRIEGFYKPISATVYGTDYASASHRFENVQASGAKLYAIEAKGAGNVFRNCTVRNTGGGVTVARPIGIDCWGPNPTLIGCDVFDMVRGPTDLETMNYHIQDAEDGGRMMRCSASNLVKNSLSFGIWFNQLTGGFQMEECALSGLHIALAGDLATGALRGRAFNYDTLSTLGSGPVLAFT